MPQGPTTVSSLADSLPLVIDSARLKREYVGTYNRTCEMIRLPEGTGLDWDEVALEQLTAGSINETTDLIDNPQMLEDSIFRIAPTQVGLLIRITKRARARLDKKVLAKIGSLGQNAMNRRKDEDYLALLDTATNSLSGAGTTLASSIISAAAARVAYGHGNEPSSGQIMGALHPYQLKDIQDEIVAGVGTYTIPEGISAEVYRRGFAGSLFNVNLFTAWNLVADASDDAKGGVHTREAVLCLQGMAPSSYSEFRPSIGGGADDLYLYDEYGFGERSAGNWLIEIYSDVLQPTG